MDEIEEDYHEAVEMLEEIYREIEEDDAEMWNTHRSGRAMRSSWSPARTTRNLAGKEHYALDTRR
jgi:hypothetical protein